MGTSLAAGPFDKITCTEGNAQITFSPGEDRGEVKVTSGKNSARFVLRSWQACSICAGMPAFNADLEQITEDKPSQGIGFVKLRLRGQIITCPDDDSKYVNDQWVGNLCMRGAELFVTPQKKEFLSLYCELPINMTLHDFYRFLGGRRSPGMWDSRE